MNEAASSDFHSALLAAAIASLRHAYSQLAAGAVRDQKQFADGLISPQIAKLEDIARG